MELLFRGSALMYLEEHNEYPFREPFQMYFIFVMAFPRDHAQVMLGPLLFNIYTNKIFDIVGRHLLKDHCYADDSQLYFSFNPSCAFSQDEAIRSMETCISDVKQWMTSDKQCLMTTKPNLL